MDTRQIPLTQGQFAIVDAADYEWLSQWKWCAGRYRYAHYAMRGIRVAGTKTLGIKMHRLIMGAQDGTFCDHINGDTLDNRRSNLRIASPLENARNCRRSISNTSGVKGVCWKSDKGRWLARITVQKKKLHLGYFISKEDAAAAYDRAAQALYGDHRRIE